MKRLWVWIKQNKLSAGLLAVIGLWLVKNAAAGLFGISFMESNSKVMMPSIAMESDSRVNYGVSKAGGASIAMPVPSSYDAVPTQAAERMKIQDTRMSLLVKNVEEVIGAIETLATSKGGYMVDANLAKPQEAASGTISIRVPAAARSEVLKQIRTLGIRVVSESVYGQDVTDEYTDLETRLATLMTNKARFEKIMDEAVRVPEILEVQREILNLQSQIDSIKGQQNYLAKSAELTKITVQLSTDELALPYAPSDAWSPEAIFKEAVRSLVGSLRGIGSLLIWIGVYVPFWGGLLLVVWLLRHRRRVISRR